MQRFGFRFISGFIIDVLVLQTVTSLNISGGPLRRSPYLWPFTDYSMYATVHYEGDLIPREVMLVEFDDGESEKVKHSDFQIGFWMFPFALASLEQGYVDALRKLAELHESLHGRRIVAFRLEDHAVMYTGDGLRDVDPIFVSEVRFDDEPGGRE